MRFILRAFLTYIICTFYYALDEKTFAICIKFITNGMRTAAIDGNPTSVYLMIHTNTLRSERGTPRWYQSIGMPSHRKPLTCLSAHSTKMQI